MREGPALAAAAATGAVDVATLAPLACLLEVSAAKPGNVAPGRHFADVRYEEFLASALAIGEPLAGAGAGPLGVTVRRAAEATRPWTSSNTNLGIVLLFAPLARAVLCPPFGLAAAPAPRAAVAPGVLREAVRHVLAATTVEDAREVYAAIRLMRPGGLGSVPRQDVAQEPTIGLLEVMRLAASYDGIANEYAGGFEVTFEIGLPALVRARADGLSWDDAVVETFLTILAGRSDTHLARRRGQAAAAEVSVRARDVLAEGGVRTAAGRRAIEAMDAALRDVKNGGNPGTTADLTAASIFVLLLAGGWHAREAGEWRVIAAGGNHAQTR